MKGLMKMTMVTTVVAFLVACGEDETPTVLQPAISPVEVFFDSHYLTLKEQSEAKEITILLFEPAKVDGYVQIEMQTENLEAIQTTPSFLGGLLELPVSVGQTQVKFSMRAIDNNVVDGDKTIKFVIKHVTEGFVKGAKDLQTVLIQDDDVTRLGIPKSYHSSAGSWGAKKTYEYDEQGRVAKVHWETLTPYQRSGTDTYYYAENGLIERINRYPNIDEYFIQEGGRIVRSEEVKNDEVTSITTYDYDDWGNVSAKSVEYRQASGEFLLGFIFVYYHESTGNLYKQETYIPSNEPGEDYVLISSRSYEQYLDIDNPFPIEIIPTIKVQQKLPTSYRIQENGVDISYSFTYTFDLDGLPTSRTATSPSGSERTTYEYY